jgi:hypothetical protein
MEDDLNFVLGNLGSWFLECKVNPTRGNMEDDLDFLKIENDLIFLNDKRT